VRSAPTAPTVTEVGTSRPPSTTSTVYLPPVARCSAEVGTVSTSFFDDTATVSRADAPFSRFALSPDSFTVTVYAGVVESVFVFRTPMDATVPDSVDDTPDTVTEVDWPTFSAETPVTPTLVVTSQPSFPITVMSELVEPALTALPLTAMMGDVTRGPSDPIPGDVKNGYDFLLKNVKPDGGIYSKPAVNASGLSPSMQRLLKGGANADDWLNAPPDPPPPPPQYPTQPVAITVRHGVPLWSNYLIALVLLMILPAIGIVRRTMFEKARWEKGGLAEEFETRGT